MNTNDRRMLWVARTAAAVVLLIAIALPFATTHADLNAAPASASPHSWVADAFPIGQAGFARGAAGTSTR